MEPRERMLRCIAGWKGCKSLEEATPDERADIDKLAEAIEKQGIDLDYCFPEPRKEAPSESS